MEANPGPTFASKYPRIQFKIIEFIQNGVPHISYLREYRRRTLHVLRPTPKQPFIFIYIHITHEYLSANKNYLMIANADLALFYMKPV